MYNFNIIYIYIKNNVIFLNNFNFNIKFYFITTIFTKFYITKTLLIFVFRSEIYIKNYKKYYMLYLFDY